MELRSGTCTLALAVLVCCPAAGQDNSPKRESLSLRDSQDLQTLLELSPADTASLPTKEVVRLCDRFLRKDSRLSLSEAQRCRLHLLRGRAYMVLANFEKAHEDFDALIRLKPADPVGRYLKARALISLGEDGRGQAVLNSLFKDSPEMPEPYVLKGIILLGDGQRDKAVSLFTKAEALLKDGRGFAIADQLYLNWALAEFQQGRFRKAIDKLDRCILSFPPLDGQNPSVFELRGYLLSELNEKERALADLLTAVRLEPTNWSPRFYLWQYYFGLEKYRIAREISRTLRKLDPNDPRVLLACSTMAARDQDMADALDLAKRIIRLSPDLRGLGTWQRGRLLCVKGEYAKALEDLQPNVEVPALQQMGAIAFVLACCPEKKLRKARVALDTARRCCAMTESRNPRYLMVLAMAHAELGEFPKAIEKASMALRLIPEDCALRTRYEGRLRLFRQARPFRFERGSSEILLY